MAELSQEPVLVVVAAGRQDPPLFVELTNLAERQGYPTTRRRHNAPAIRRIMVVPQEIGDHKDTIDILLDKICSMREELLTIGRALDQMQLEANESRQQKYRLRAISR